MPTEFTFSYYLENYNNKTTSRFKVLIAEDLQKLPNKVTSSKQIRKYLTLDTNEKQQLFKTVYLDYFVEKVGKM
jgi:hypothetical protein